MPLLCAYAAALDAVAADLARVPLGSRDPESPYIAIDEARRELLRLAGRMRHGLMPESANDAEPLCLPSLPITGRGQILHVVTNGPRR